MLSAVQASPGNGTSVRHVGVPCSLTAPSPPLSSFDSVFNCVENQLNIHDSLDERGEKEVAWNLQ